MQHGGREALTEGLQQIENDPDVLRNVLRIMREGKVLSNEIDLDPSIQPDPLTTSGFVRLDDRQFTIKSDLHFRLLEWHFTPERVGRIFLAAGDWESAIHHLGVEIRSGNRGTAEERARVMLGAVSTMYSVHSKRDAFGYLARGFETAYPHLRLRLYDYDKEQNVLVRIDPLNPAARTRRAEDIPIGSSAATRDPRAAQLARFLAAADRHHHMTLYVPLRPSPEDIQGLVAVEGFIARSDYRRKHEQIRGDGGLSAPRRARSEKSRRARAALRRRHAARAGSAESADADAALDELQGRVIKTSSIKRCAAP